MKNWLVSFNEEPKSTWLVRSAKKVRKFINCEEVVDENDESSMFIHDLRRNSKSKRRKRMLVGGRR